MNWFVYLIALFRLRLWRKKLKKNKGFTIRILYPARFLDNLNKNKVPYVVLRWYDDVLDVLQGRIVGEDIDILVRHGYLKEIAASVPLFNFGPKNHKVRFDIYSDSGRSGLSYKKMPYYPPVRADFLLNTRQWDERGWWRISKGNYIYALLYHYCYHKGTLTGIPMHPEDSDYYVSKKDYVALLQKEVSSNGLKIPVFNNLLEIHEWLFERGWSIPFDLIAHIECMHSFLKYVYDYEAARLQVMYSADSANTVGESLCMLFGREELRVNGLESFFKKEIYNRFDVVSFSELDEFAVRRLLWHTRGGNWLAYKDYKISIPIFVFIVRLTSETVRTKEFVREMLNAEHSGSKENWLHGTDDFHEFISSYLAFKGAFSVLDEFLFIDDSCTDILIIEK